MSDIAALGTHPLVNRLRAARRGGTLIVSLPADERPADLAQAYAIAAAVATDAGPVVGWKIGATSPRGQAMLGLAEPFLGGIHASGVQPAPGRWPHDASALTVDAELLFEIGAVDPARDPVHWVRAVRLGLELNAPRYADPFSLGGLAIIADQGAHAGLVVGPAIDLPSERWPDVTVSLAVDGEVQAQGQGSAVLGDPAAALRWLAAALPSLGLALEPGQLVASGNLCFVTATRGQNVVGDFGSWGAVALLGDNRAA